jgi:hypothetical protein
MNDILIKSFDATNELIKKNPADEIKFITDFNNTIIDTINKSSNKTFVRSSTFSDGNPYNIKIHNNFQHYNNETFNSKNKPEQFQDYITDLRGGFKDYFTFN